MFVRSAEGRGGGGLSFGGGSSEYYWATFTKYYIFLESSAQAQSIGTLVGWFDWKGGSGCLVIKMHGMSPSRPRGCVQANYQQLIPNLQFTHCSMHKLHEWSEYVLWQRFWLDLSTKQVVSARACANQFCPMACQDLFGMRTVQADSCLNSEQIDTLFICVGGQEGVLGESFLAGGPNF